MPDPSASVAFYGAFLAPDQARALTPVAPDQARARAERGWGHWKCEFPNLSLEEFGFKDPVRIE